MNNQGIITWHNGSLILEMNGRKLYVPHEEPISASTDSHYIANLFGDFKQVEHNGDTIMVDTGKKRGRPAKQAPILSKESIELINNLFAQQQN